MDDIVGILIGLAGGLVGCIMFFSAMSPSETKPSQYPEAWSSGLSEEDKKIAGQREKEHRHKKAGLRLIGALSSPDTEIRGTISFPDSEVGAVSLIPPPEKEHA